MTYAASKWSQIRSCMFFAHRDLWRVTDTDFIPSWHLNLILDILFDSKCNNKSQQICNLIVIDINIFISFHRLCPSTIPHIQPNLIERTPSLPPSSSRGITRDTKQKPLNILRYRTRPIYFLLLALFPLIFPTLPLL